MTKKKGIVTKEMSNDCPKTRIWKLAWKDFNTSTFDGIPLVEQNQKQINIFSAWLVSQLGQSRFDRTHTDWEMDGIEKSQ